MISILRRTASDDKLVEIDNPVAGCWIRVMNPSKEEISMLTKEHNIPPELIEDFLDVDEQPRIEREDDFVSVIIRVPYFESDKSASSIQTTPLGIIITEKFIITIGGAKDQILEGFVTGKLRSPATTKKTRFLLEIVSRAIQSYTKNLRIIQKQISRKEDSLKRLKDDDLVSLVEIEKTLIYLSTSAISNGNVLEKIFSGKSVRLYKDDQDILEDMIMDNNQLVQMSRINLRIISNIKDSYSSIISNNLNRVMKFLAAFTVILTIPTIISSVYGMNVNLPMQNNPFMFIYILILTLIMSAVVIFFFYKKNWL